MILQIGDGDVDHAYWGRPEDMTMPRPAFYTNSNAPGADLAAEAAAALAATSIAIRAFGDEDYANNCIYHARQLFDFADQHRGKYSDYIPGDFYE